MKNKARKLKLDVRRVQVLFLIMALLLLGGIALKLWAGYRTLDSQKEIQTHNDMVEQLQGLLSMMQDAETGQRGYLLTKNPHYLDPYEMATANIPQQLRNLQAAADGGIMPAATVQKLIELIGQKLDELTENVEMTRSGEQALAVERVKLGTGMALMDRIRDVVGELKSQQLNLRRLAEKRAFESVHTRAAIFITVALANLCFLAWAYHRIHRHLTDQFVATLDIQRQKDILAVTLASIGDAVILTDTNARITFLNKVAEDLTGWKASEALDRPCAEVFRIINEHSREPVESPVDKVLQNGTIVGLANHTLLIRKDGTEVPIDDSGAPIREFDGTIRGVVLVFRDFTSYKDAEKALISAKNEVEASNRAKDKFLATLSHELRTPLTPVLATIHSWENNPESAPRLKADLQLIRRNVELQARLIDDLLDLTRIEHGKLFLSRETVNAHEIIESVAGYYRKDCLSRDIRLTMKLDAKRNHVDADPARLHQILWNILGNAVKFSREGGRVTVSTANPAADKLEITISDTGIGMDEETLKLLFERFEQGNVPPEWKAQGLGLGLSIAKALMEAHGGTLRAASEGINKGATFVCTFPTMKAPAALPPSRTANRPARPVKNLHILVVEDHEDTGMVMCAVLRGMGHAVDLCTTVADAVKKVRENTYDAWLSDVGLPDGSGLDFIRKARETSQTPAIALTGYGMAEDVEECLQAGFSAHLTKPVDIEKLQKALALATLSIP